MNRLLNTNYLYRFDLKLKRMANNTTQKGGIGIGMVLFLIFLVLKLTGHIAWSWWWITAPLWGPFALIITILGVTLIIGLISQSLTKN